MQTMALWVLIAFVFGYFFHAIRGQNGFQKSLSFIVALTIPTILLRFVMEPEVAARIQLIELVRLTAFVLLLALVAFDLRVLRNAGRSRVRHQFVTKTTAFWRLFRGSQKRKSKAGKGI